MPVHRENMPNVWGASQLLAMSALDGQTLYTEPFVLHTGAAPGSLRVLLPVDAAIEFANMPALQFDLVLGDVALARSDRGRYGFAFLDRQTLVGQLPQGVTLQAAGQSAGDKPLLVAQEKDLAVWAAASGSRWALLMTAQGPAQAAWLWKNAQTADLDKLIQARSAFVAAVPVPAGLSPQRQMLLRKAVSVMKVNYESACGDIGRRWSTPDRWPHRKMWLWDSAFHGLGMCRIDPAAAKDAVLAMLEKVEKTGLLSHMIGPTGETSDVTQPPILAWAVMEILQHTKDHTWATECLPYLQAYLNWQRMNRDKNGNGVPEWYIHGQVLCRCGESGLDNSPRFDGAVLLDAVDFGSWLAHDFACLAQVAQQLGQSQIAQESSGHAKRIGEATNQLLWCEQERFYLDRDFEGRFVPVKAVSGFMPLMAGIASPAQAQALAEHLTNPATFGAPVPAPSVSLDTGTYCKDMWRGPTWINTNYMIYRGLRRYGMNAQAAAIKEATLAAVEKWYLREGCVFEYYDSLGVTSPRGLDRKQRLISGRGIAPISDYHWTAAMTAALILE